MSADLALRLRSLTQDYHDGRLNFATYRSMRAALLDSLVSGAASAAAVAAVAATQPRAGSWQLQSDAITRPGKPRVANGPGGMESGVGAAAGPVDAGAATAGSVAVGQSRMSARASGAYGATAATSTSLPGGAPVAHEKRSPIVALAIGFAVLTIAGIVIWLWLGRSSSEAGSSSGAPAVAEQGRIQELLLRFTDRGDWSDAHLVTLNTDLLELGSASLSEAAGEPWFQRFAEEVRRRLKEQQALAATPLNGDNSPLAALAVTVGLDLNAPDAAIHIAALPAPPRAEDAVSEAPASRASTTSDLHMASVPPVVEVEKGSTPAKTSVPPTAEAIDRTKSGAAIAVSAETAAPKPDAVTVAQPDTHEGACRVELIGTRRPLCHDLLGANGAEAPPLALIPAGAFEMGSTAAPEEQPVHRVTIRAPFAISINEVSQGEFKQFCAQTERACPRQPWSGDDYPMVNVSWEDARAYVAWLSSVTHHRYSLPSEAQWEYAARAGRTGLLPNGDTLSPTDAHYSMLAKQTTAAPRGQKFNANAFRLLHTLGNVREWVEDAWAPTFAGAPSDGTAAGSPSTQQRVARGGSYADGATRLRLSLREGLPASTRDATTGFRIVRELP